MSTTGGCPPAHFLPLCGGPGVEQYFFSPFLSFLQAPFVVIVDGGRYQVGAPMMKGRLTVHCTGWRLQACYYWGLTGALLRDVSPWAKVKRPGGCELGFPPDMNRNRSRGFQVGVANSSRVRSLQQGGSSVPRVWCSEMDEVKKASMARPSNTASARLEMAAVGGRWLVGQRAESLWAPPSLVFSPSLVGGRWTPLSPPRP